MALENGFVSQARMEGFYTDCSLLTIEITLFCFSSPYTRQRNLSPDWSLLRKTGPRSLPHSFLANLHHRLNDSVLFAIDKDIGPPSRRSGQTDIFDME